jgi:hypothetical protein
MSIDHAYGLARALATCARERGFIAAAEGDRARYWRELAASRRLLGFISAADDFDALAAECSR